MATIWLVVAIPLSAVVLVTYLAWYSARTAVVEQERQGYAVSIANSFELLMLNMRFAMRASGADIAETGPTSPQSESEYRRLVSSYPTAYVAFVDRGGRVLGASRPDLIGEDMSDDRAFRTAMLTTHGGAIEPSEVASGGVVGFHVAQAIPARPGRVTSVMMMFVDVRRLHRSFPLEVPDGGISIVDSAGQVVFQNEDIRFALARSQWGEAFRFVRQALRGQVATTQDFQFPAGGRRIGVFVPIRAYGWAAGSSVTPGVALAPFYRARVFGLPILLGVSVLSLLASIGIAYGIRRSLDQLAEDARRVGSGHLDRPVQTDRVDEIGEVARSLEAARIDLRDAREQAQRLLEAERQRARLGQSMVEINNELLSALDIDHTLPDVLRRACEELGGNGAVVTDRVEGGWRVRALSGLADSGLRPGAFFDDEQAPTSMHVLQNREHEPYFVEHIQTMTKVNQTYGGVVGFVAWAVYPLIVRREMTGTLTVFFAEAHAFPDVERDYLRRVAFAVSLAEENSRLYKAEHRVAETLQTALLALPEHIPGIKSAHLYRSATEEARVGGDFYDLFELEHRRVGITIGDISGHGIDAAVLTSLVKNTIRVQATQEDKAPNEVMASASSVLYDNSSAEIFATVFFGVLHLEDGLLEFCSAGHPTGARICSSGGTQRLPANSPLIGAFTQAQFELSTEHLDRHDLLFLYTDGLTEARRDGELFGEERLFELLTHERGGHPDRTLRIVVDEVLAFSRGRLSDDVAILAVQRGDDLQ
ncbi:MAG TPA: SpoIIE family protein phosphatase [Coriobacteriia bacterium]|nr:SpoIIE family protein phosphatase [Coriobacteriia bacterium]